MVLAISTITNYFMMLRRENGGGRAAALVFHVSYIGILIFTVSGVFFGYEKDLNSDCQLEFYKKNAEERIKQSEAKAAESYAQARASDEKAQEAKVRVAEAEARAAVAYRVAGEARVKAAQIEKENLGIKSKLAWRHLNGSQFATIARVAKRFSGQMIVFRVPSEDPESVGFARELCELFIKFGWRGSVMPVLATGEFDDGDKLRTRSAAMSGGHLPKAAIELGDALFKAGITSHREPIEEATAPPNVFYLTIGHKVAFR
ncbi:hypothetical protein [Burkholderia cenocepacia]|uniref:hypothetical protein n=1 Tax=Burkholderia cenocepacia TaxID=95486 RepID=UPI001903CFB8|nr:hypothetical protein [Burkholderia cenocepacia]MBJ9693659.1 hypothetical protein [Burkholderia cenocepacia]